MVRILRLLAPAILVLTGAWTGTSQAQPPPLRVFYAVHAHFVSGQAGMGLVDGNPRTNPQGARHAAEGLDDLARALESQGAKGSFQLTAQMAEAVCGVAGRRGLVQGLARRGHEVGAHGHGAAEIQAAIRALSQHCGVVATSGSGILSPQGFAGAGAGKGRPRPGGGPQAQGGSAAGSVALQTRQVAAAGLEVLTMNATPLSSRPSRYYNACGGRLGEGNQGWTARGALPHPWRPDPAGDVCGHHPGGPVLFVDHTTGEWMQAPGGGHATVDTVGDREFDKLRVLFDGAVRGPIGPGETWGFVSHLHEYMVGGKVMGQTSAASLAALERFLADVDARGAGRVEWVTATQIGTAVR